MGFHKAKTSFFQERYTTQFILCKSPSTITLNIHDKEKAIPNLSEPPFCRLNMFYLFQYQLNYRNFNVWFDDRQAQIQVSRS